MTISGSIHRSVATLELPKSSAIATAGALGKLDDPFHGIERLLPLEATALMAMLGLGLLASLAHVFLLLAAIRKVSRG